MSLPGGGVRFRLWAPALESLDLELDDGGPAIPMRAAGGGWFARETERAESGSRYRYRLPDGLLVPDPCSRGQADDVHGWSVVVDPNRYAWRDANWRGRPWEETVLYELHVGTVTPDGSFDALQAKLDDLVDLGVTAIELMPVAAFSGRRNWGYDGVLPFAPAACYGTPESLCALVDAVHGHGLMVFLDVVYNHFGPDGNYLHAYAPRAFTDRYDTPWGAAIDFTQPPVRDMVIANALHWLVDYRFDGLRLDAVHAIHDDGPHHVLEELAETVHNTVRGERYVHLVLENDNNTARYLRRGDDGRPRLYTAQWNDDFHHCAHVVLTGETDGYYTDYADHPIARLGKALAEGFVYQGEASRHRGRARGEPSGDLTPAAFVNFLQNHDQVGNRAFGERLTRLAAPQALRALVAVMLLAPQVPLLFMGEEWGCARPFLFFCDFHDGLADAVRDGRRREFARFAGFADAAARDRIPDPNAMSTFAASMIDWPTGDGGADGWLVYYRSLLQLRHRHIVPRLPGTASGGRVDVRDERALHVTWRLGDGARLELLANLSDASLPGVTQLAGTVLFEEPAGVAQGLEADAAMPAWSVIWLLDSSNA